MPFYRLSLLRPFTTLPAFRPQPSVPFRLSACRLSATLPVFRHREFFFFGNSSFASMITITVSIWSFRA